MLDNTTTDNKRSLSFKKIFRPQPIQTSRHRSKTSTANLPISPPILHHSTSIYSVVSPTRASFGEREPLSMPVPPVPRVHNSVSPLPSVRRQYKTMTTEQFKEPASNSNPRRHSCSSTLHHKRKSTTSATAVEPPPPLPLSRGSPAAAAAISPSPSKSTPMKIKTYNVHNHRVVSASQKDLEKERKRQELEDLISGRRGSTLKLSLTPKVVS